jgi:hypothetical protein
VARRATLGVAARDAALVRDERLDLAQWIHGAESWRSGAGRRGVVRVRRMDMSRISFGEMVAAVSGLALFIFMLLPWFGVEATADLGGQEVSVGGGTTNAWESFGAIDLLLFLVVILAVAMAIARAAGAMPSGLPAPPGLIVAGIGALAVILILYRLIDPPGTEIEGSGGEIDVTRKIGVFLGLIAAGGITYGGYTAMNERASGQAPPAAPPPQPPAA